MAIRPVIDEDGKKYILIKEIGAGATANVYHARNEDETAQPPDDFVAVKVAKYNAERAGDFWKEVEIVQALREQAPRNLPRMRRAWEQDDPNRRNTQATRFPKYIVMEWVPEGWQLQGHGKGEPPRLDERLALQAAIQYAHLLWTAHGLGITTRGDRKAADLRWTTDAPPRLIVLDWNRADFLPSLPSTEDGMDQARLADYNNLRRVRIDLIRQDVRLFGQLWCELILGQRLTTAPALDNDDVWQGISRGTRLVLARALESSEHYGYQVDERDLSSAAQQLLDDLKTHAGALELKAEGNFQELIDNARNLDTESDTDPDEHIRRAEQILNLLGLVPPDAAIDRDRFMTLQIRATEAVAFPHRRAGAAVIQIESELKFGAYEQAANTARRALVELYGEKNEQAVQKSEPVIQKAVLRLLRWQIVAAVGVKGNSLSLNMRDAILGLQGTVRHIETTFSADASVAGTALDGAVSGLLAQILDHAEIQELVQPLRYEIEIRRALLPIEQARRLEDIAGMEAAYKLANDFWNKLRQVTPLYAQTLSTDLPAFVRWQEALERHAALDPAKKSVQEKYERAYLALPEAFGQVVDRLAHLEDGKTLLDEAMDKVIEARENLGGWGPLSEEQKARDEFVHRLSEIANRMRGGGAEGVLVAAKIIQARQAPSEHRILVVSNFQWTDLVQNEWAQVIRYWLRVAADIAAELAGKPGIWPDELDVARELLEQMSNMPTLTSEFATVIGGLKEKVANRIKRQNKARTDLRVQGDGKDLERIVNDKNNKIDIQLEKLTQEDLPLEVLDRPRAASIKEQERYRVVALLNARRYRELTANLEEWSEKVGTLIASLNKEGAPQRLLSETDELKHVLDDVEQHRRAFDKLNATIAKTGLAAELEKANNISTAIKTANQNLNGVRETLSSLIGPNQMASTSSLDVLASKVAPLTRSITDLKNDTTTLRDLRDQLDTQKQSDLVRSASERVRELRRAITLGWTAKGIQGIRELNQEGLDTARGCYTKAQSAAGLGGMQGALTAANTNDLEINSALDLLGESIRWFENIQKKPGLVDLFRNWKEALKKQDLQEARTKWQNITSTSNPPESRASLVVSELRSEQMALERTSLNDSTPKYIPAGDGLTIKDVQRMIDEHLRPGIGWHSHAESDEKVKRIADQILPLLKANTQERLETLNAHWDVLLRPVQTSLFSRFKRRQTQTRQDQNLQKAIDETKEFVMTHNLERLAQNERESLGAKLSEAGKLFAQVLEANPPLELQLMCLHEWTLELPASR